MNEIKVHTGLSVVTPPAAVVIGLWAARLVGWVHRWRKGPSTTPR